ncbi:MAG: hypothetical protein AAGI50_00585 [Pseudomonadota bacterium]
MKRLLPVLIPMLAAVPAAAADSASDTHVTAVDLTFNLHVDDGNPEQDVFIKTDSTAREVWRPQPGHADLAAPIFASSEPQAHAPLDPTAIGPFPAGQPLGLTLGAWLAATGSGEYRCDGSQGHLEIEFAGLVPNGVYTLWHFFMVNGKTEPFIGSFDLPVGAFDGSQAAFSADADGNASYDQTFASCLQLSGEQLMAGLALNWHSDGQTYGMLPGDFGQNAHIQIYTALPTRPDL